jgi:protease IV
MRLLPALLCFAPLALAQTAQVGTTDPSRGITLLPGGSALANEPTSMAYNPAGLRAQGGPSLIYLHEASRSRAHDADAVFLGTSMGDVVGLGLSIESLRPFSGPHQGKVSFGAAAGGELFSAGLTLNTLHAGTVGGLVTADLGILTRPMRWLALGAALRSLNAPSNATTSINREYLLGVGLRPFGERVTVGVDWVIAETSPINQSRLQYTANVMPINGLRIGLGFSHAFTPVEPLTLQASLGIDLEHFGYTQGIGVSGFNRVDWQFVGRASFDKRPSIIPQKKIAVLNLEGIGSSSSGTTLGALLGVEAEDRYLRTLRLLYRAAEDESLAAVVVKVEGAGLGLARADELHQALLHLKRKGKKVYAYALSVGDAEYLVASAADAIYAAPEAMLMVDGLKSTIQFFGGAAEKFGIDVDVARVGDFKTFPEQFTRTSMSPAQRITLEATLDNASATLASRIQAARKLSPETWKQVVDEGLKPVAKAKALKEIDEVATPQAFDDALGQLLPNARVARDYYPFDARTDRWGNFPQIAVIPVLGSIAGGSNQNTPLAQIAGAQSFIELLGQAANDPDVKAIVIRVDSGGGDALASDLMYRAVLEAKKKKPVIASMGDVAASGGYYIAMGADRIFASPTTITGSIGIFFAKPAAKKLAQSLGITQDSVTRGTLPGMTDLIEPWTEAQRKAAQAWVDSGYDTFITEVAASRKLTKEQVDAVARGRVWSGTDAKAKGLVDELGGLMDAVAAAQAKSRFSGQLEAMVWKSRSGGLGGLLSVAAPAALEMPVPTQSQALPVPDALAKMLGAHAWLLAAPALQARLEYTLEVK